MTKERSRNIVALSLAAFTFFAFAVAELIASLTSNSLSLFGDAIAMIIDAMTYCFNLYAERQKLTKALSEIQIVKLEVYYPLFSLTILYGLCIYIIYDASGSLASNEDDDEGVNETTMLIFAVINLLIDFFNVCCFQRARSARIIESELENQKVVSAIEPKSNANMCSAYTHVTADTLRSLAVLAAVAVSKLTGIDGSITDAVAAIFITFVVFCTSYPLIKMLRVKWARLKELQAAPEQVEDVKEVAVATEVKEVKEVKEQSV